MKFKFEIWYTDENYTEEIIFEHLSQELMSPKDATVGLSNSIQGQMVQAGTLCIVDENMVSHIIPRERIAKIQVRMVDALPHLVRN